MEATLDQPAFTPTLELTPMSASTAPGGVIAFSASMNYPAGMRPLRQPVKWAVAEKDGGEVTMNGRYTAPAKPGTYHVSVARTDPRGQGLSRVATVTVK